MTATQVPETSARGPRFGGLLLRASRATNRLALTLAGKRWNPLFSIVRHIGRRSGRTYETPVAARRVDGGFVVALAFGSDAQWHRNLIAAAGGVIRWRGVDYVVGAPEPIEVDAAVATFNAIQRAGLRAADIDGYIRLADAPASVPTA